MKLTFKDLKQQKFIIEAEPSELISDVKEKISQEKGWEPSAQKLIYSGKILQDTHTVESYKIEEKGFIVCMVSKPKAAPTSSASSSKTPSTPAPAVTSTPSAPPAAPLQSSNTSTANVPSTPSPAGVSSTPSLDASSTPAPPSGLAMGAERAAQIAEMEAMGFERAEIDRAMRAAFFNGERAIEYLLNGIPANLRNEQRAPAPNQGGNVPPPAPQVAAAPSGGGDEPVNLFEAAQAAQGNRGAGGPRGGAAALGLGATAGAGAGAGAGGDVGLGNLEFLRNNPQFQQLRQVVQQQPAMLEAILQQVGAGNPALAQMIAQNPEQFMQLLSEHGDDDAPLPPGAQTIDVTPEEAAAIDRLVLLGFHRDQAIQAYFACDKNEELAANFLFDQPDDDLE